MEPDKASNQKQLWPLHRLELNKEQAHFLAKVLKAQGYDAGLSAEACIVFCSRNHLRCFLQAINEFIQTLITQEDAQKEGETARYFSEIGSLQTMILNQLPGPPENQGDSEEEKV